MMSKRVIECKNLSFHYPGNEERQVLDGINLNIHRGEFIGIIGANGSGKSTLAKMFNALLLPEAGTVAVNGMDTADEANTYLIRQQVGMVFQNPDNQIVATIVEEDVAFGPENLGYSPEEIRRRVDESLKAVNLTEYSLHAPHLLSGGQKQRLAIAGVLAIAPEVIIFDESTAMLDPQGRREVLAAIDQLNDQGITIIMITHHMQEVSKADRVFVMQDGRVVLEDSPRGIFSRGRELRQYGLDIPQITALALELGESGTAVPGDILTVEEMVEQLCRLK